MSTRWKNRSFHCSSLHKNIHLNNHPWVKMYSTSTKDSRWGTAAHGWSTEVREDSLKSVERKDLKLPVTLSPKLKQPSVGEGEVKWVPNLAVDPSTRPIPMNTITRVAPVDPAYRPNPSARPASMVPGSRPTPAVSRSLQYQVSLHNPKPSLQTHLALDHLLKLQAYSTARPAPESPGSSKPPETSTLASHHRPGLQPHPCRPRLQVSQAHPSIRPIPTNLRPTITRSSPRISEQAVC